MSSRDTKFSWIQLPAAMKSLDKFRYFVLQEAEKVSLPAKKSDKIELILEEVLLNIINYAYSPDEQAYIDIGCKITPDNLFCIRVQDRGIPFNPLTQEAPQLEEDIEKRQVGGLGIFLTKQMADSLDYHYKDGNNILDIGLYLA